MQSANHQLPTVLGPAVAPPALGPTPQRAAIRRAPLLVLPVLCLLATGALPQREPVEKGAPIPPKIEDFEWLAGQWRGEGFGGTCEETWSHPLAGTMVGTFRLVKNDEVVFYEIMVIGPDDDGFALKVKHFSKEFVAWEDKEGAVRFPYESVEKNDARFAGLTLARSGNELEIKLRMRERDGTTRWEPIRLKRYPATGSKK